MVEIQEKKKGQDLRNTTDIIQSLNLNPGQEKGNVRGKGKEKEIVENKAIETGTATEKETDNMIGIETDKNLGKNSLIETGGTENQIGVGQRKGNKQTEKAIVIITEKEKIGTQTKDSHNTRTSAIVNLGTIVNTPPTTPNLTVLYSIDVGTRRANPIPIPIASTPVRARTTQKDIDMII